MSSGRTILNRECRGALAVGMFSRPIGVFFLESRAMKPNADFIISAIQGITIGENSWNCTVSCFGFSTLKFVKIRM